jgi:hypothetical protein
MKGIKLILTAAMVVFIAVMVPFVSQKVYAADHIAYLVPAESAVVETGGGETLWVLMPPTAFTNDAGYIERLLPAESAVAETGGGEIPLVLMAPTQFGNDRIELLLPAK